MEKLTQQQINEIEVNYQVVPSANMPASNKKASGY